MHLHNRMAVFISYSRTRSEAMAKAIESLIVEFLPNVHVRMFPPASGSQYFSELDEWFSSITYAILCVTPENRNAPWMNYEAGVFSHKPGSVVASLLLDMEPTDLPAPLDQRVAQRANPDGVAKLICDISTEFGQKQPSRRSIKRRWKEIFESRRAGLENEVMEKIDHNNPNHVTILESCNTIQSRSGTEFRRYLAKEIMSRCETALVEISNRELIYRSPEEFIGAAIAALKNGERAWALCGGKPWSKREKTKYYGECYAFAQRKWQENDRVDESYMTRLFLKQMSGSRRNEQLPAIQAHFDLRPKGVCGRIIKPEGRKLPVAPQFRDLMLQEGFGFILIESVRPVALVHRGTTRGRFYGAKLQSTLR